MYTSPNVWSKIASFPQACALIRIPKPKNPRYHCLFLYDDANVAIGRDFVSVAQALLPVRFCCGKAREMAFVAPSLTIAFLIANLELESRPTHRKLSPLRISSRKFLPIFDPSFQGPALSPAVTRHLLPGSLNADEGPLATRFLIYGSAIKTRCNSLKT